MAFLKNIVLFLASAAALVLAGQGGDTPTDVAAQQCGDNQTISCCNSGSDTLLGLDCLAIPVRT